MFEISVNYPAVLASAIASMVIGYIWYGPLFGKRWMTLTGMTDKNMQDAKSGMGKSYGLMMGASLVSAYILNIVINNIGISDAGEGVILGILVWLGFVATTHLSGYLFSVPKKPWALYILEVGYYLVNYGVMGVILAVWQ